MKGLPNYPHPNTEQIARLLQRKFNYNRAEYARHPEKDQFFDDMAAEAIYQMELLGFTLQSDQKQARKEAIEDTLVKRLCQRNGWQYGDNEDYDQAVKDVKWFMRQFVDLGKLNENDMPASGKDGYMEDKVYIDQGIKPPSRLEQAKLSYKTGIQEVAGWIMGHQDGFIAGQDIQTVAGNACKYGDTSHLLVHWLEWQQKCKEWEIK